MKKIIIVILILVIIFCCLYQTINFKNTFEYYNDIKNPKKIYIISNYKNIKEKTFNTINNDDLVVLMNHAHHDNYKFDKNDKLLFIRSSDNNYHGYKKTFNNRYITTHFIYNDLNNISESESENIKRLYLDFKDNKEMIYIRDVLIKNNYPKDKSPTTGFITYLFLKNKYPNSEIILVGFVGNNVKGYNGWYKHDYDFEQEYYKKNNQIIIS